MYKNINSFRLDQVNVLKEVFSQPLMKHNNLVTTGKCISSME